jgi:Double zinc ribbon
VLTCFSCGHENPLEQKFCGECGARLVAPGEIRRRLITALFCDLVGSTELGERLDAELLRKVLDRYFHAMRAAIQHHGGTVEKFQFAELEGRLYRSRDSLSGALDEYDRTCQAHDDEMETICEAFRKKWAKVPLLQTYRQMAIRQEKEKNWRACLWWAERGLYL